MTVCPNCNTIVVGRDPDKDQMRERIAELEAENGRMDAFCKEFIGGEDNPREYKTLFNRAEQAEAEVERLKSVSLQRHSDWMMEKARANKAEAELAALRARRCEGCRYLFGSSYCKVIEYIKVADFACNRWAARWGDE